MQAVNAPRTRRRTINALVGAAVLAALATPAAASATDLTVTPSNLDSVFASAQPGDRVLLASGDYGTFSGGAKSGAITVMPQPGATATVRVNLNNATGIRLEGLTIPSLLITGGRTRDITVANSRFTGGAVVRPEEMANANILFDGNTHAGINVCGNCFEGRLQIGGYGPQPAGVTVRNSTFGPGGDADGMQIGANGVQVLNNTFTGIKQVSAVHTDSLQLYGAGNTVIRGNLFRDFDVAIMAPDGGRNELIADNVFVGNGSYRPAIQLGSHQGTQFVHNTVKNIDVHMDRKTENAGNPTRDGVVRDNVFVNGGIGGYSTNSSYCSNCTFSHNLFDSSARADGSNAIVGTPVFTGGAEPGTYAGWTLASGSPGKGDASDGSDLGIRAGGGTPAPAPTPSPTPTPLPTPTPTPTQTPTPTPTPSPPPAPSPTPPSDQAARAVWTTPADANVGTAVTLDGSGSEGDGPLACTWKFENEDGSIVWETISGCTISKTFRNADMKYVSLEVRDADGDTHANRQSFAVAQPATDTPARALWTAPTSAQVDRDVTLDGTRSEGDGPLACTWRFESRAGTRVYSTATGCKVTRTFRTTGDKYVRLTVRDADGDTDASRKSFAVGSR